MMILSCVLGYLMKHIHRCLLHTQGEQRLNISFERDTSGQPGDKILRNMCGTAHTSNPCARVPLYSVSWLFPWLIKVFFVLSSGHTLILLTCVQSCV